MAFEAPPPAAAAELLEALPLAHRLPLEEVLRRSARVAAARHEVAAARQRAPQVRALPDPEIQLTLFALPPETRVGPQRGQLQISQRIPVYGKLGLAEQAAALAVVAAHGHLESVRLEVLTEARRLLEELAFLEEHRLIATEERDHLRRHEVVARSRYATGAGRQQEVLRLQSAITRAEQELLALEVRHGQLLSQFNALRGAAAQAPLAGRALLAASSAELLPEDLPAEEVASEEERSAEVPGTFFFDRQAGEVPGTWAEPELESWVRAALRDRPDMAAARVAVERFEPLVELARRDRWPDLRIGLGWTEVGERRDAAGRRAPPQGNGDDVLALTAGVAVPLARERRRAAVEEQVEKQRAASARLLDLERRVAARVGELLHRLPLLESQRRLTAEVLLPQAQAALASAETAYATAQLSALEILDAEHTLFEVRLALARITADVAIARAQLEGELASPLIDFVDPVHRSQDSLESPAELPGELP